MVRVNEQNLAELLTQIFDYFLSNGIDKPDRLAPIMSMLVKEKFPHALSQEALERAFNDLSYGLRACLWGFGLKKIMQLDQGEFNYGFHSIRGGDIVVTYLSNTDDPRKY